MPGASTVCPVTSGNGQQTGIIQITQALPLTAPPGCLPLEQLELPAEAASSIILIT